MRIVHRCVCRMAVFLCAWLFVFGGAVSAGSSDFDTRALTVPRHDLRSGGPPKDGIPALTQPRWVRADQADFLSDTDLVIGLVIGEDARAYPLRILNWHEIVNDTVGDIPVAVTWCPLTASAVVFDRRVEGKILEWGVSGLLYQSNVVFYDRLTSSLWSQLKGRGLSGRFSDVELSVLPADVRSWKSWREAHPETKVLSPVTGYSRDYQRDPYERYHQTADIFFPIEFSKVWPAKSLVVGLQKNGKALAVPLSQLPSSGEELKISWQEKLWRLRREGRRSALVRDEQNQPVPAVIVYWFAWSAFHPETEIFRTKP